MTRLLVPAGLALLSWGLATPVVAQDASPEETEEALAYAWSNAMYTMYHEIGHMFVDQFAIPVLSKEEDAADNLATLMLLEDFAESEYRILEDAAYGWSLSSAWGEDEITDEWFYDEHSLDQQRAFAMVCLLVGSDKATFGQVADDWGMDEDRQDACQADYEQAAMGWGEVLDPFRHEEQLEESMIAVIYDPADPGYEEVAEYLQRWELLETAAARVESQFGLPAPVTFRATNCGEDNAYYDASVPEVTLCYEHAAGHFDSYLADLLGDDEAAEELGDEEE